MVANEVPADNLFTWIAGVVGGAALLALGYILKSFATVDQMNRGDAKSRDDIRAEFEAKLEAATRTTLAAVELMLREVKVDILGIKAQMTINGTNATLGYQGIKEEIAETRNDIRELRNELRGK